MDPTLENVQAGTLQQPAVNVSEGLTTPPTPKPPGLGITWAMDALENVSTVVIEEDDEPEVRKPSIQPELPQVDVRELARRRGSDPFSGYNVADIYDHADAAVLGSRKKSFDPKTFKMYAPTMDVDALCSELLNFAGDILSTRTVGSQGQYQEDAYDDAEEQARLRLQRAENRNASTASTGPHRIASFRKGTNHAKFSREGLESLLRSSHDRGGASGASGDATAQGSRAAVVSLVDQPGHVRATTSPLSPQIAGRTGEFDQGTHSERVSPCGDCPTNATGSSGTSEPVTTAGKKRLAMLLEGLRNGDFNAEFIQSIQQLRNPEDAVAAIGTYYDEGRDVAHKQAVAARRAKLKLVAAVRGGGATNESSMRESIHNAPRPSSGSSRRSIAARRSTSAVDANRPGTPPSGEYERRKVLLKVLEQRRESEIRRINEKNSTQSALQKQRSMSRLKSLHGSSMSSFMRRRSSWMRANGEVTASLGALSVRWKRRLFGSVTMHGNQFSPQTLPAAPQRPDDAAPSDGHVPGASKPLPDVYLLFFRHATNRVLTVADILNSTARFLGTLSYAYFFPPHQPEIPSQLSLEASMSQAADRGTTNAASQPQPFSAEEASTWCQALAKDISSNAEGETAAQCSERVQQAVFPMVHHRIRTMLLENALADTGKGSTGILFFSAMSKFGTAAEFFETPNGRRVLVSRDDVPACPNDVSVMSTTSDDERRSRTSPIRTSTMGSSGEQLWEVGNSMGRGGGFTDKRALPVGGEGTRRGTTARPVFLDPPSPRDDSPGSPGSLRSGELPSRSIDAAAGNNTSSHALCVDDILGVDEHRRRIAEHSRSVLKYPARAPPTYVLSAPTSLLQRMSLPSPKTPPHGTPSGKKATSGSDAQRGGGTPWSAIFERREQFPPLGLDVAHGVREGHIPRMFESVTPRPTAQQPLRWYHGCTTPGSSPHSARASSRASRATLPSRDGGTSVSSIMSPSGHAIHKFQRLPQKVLLSRPDAGSPALMASDKSEVGAGLFPLLMPSPPPVHGATNRGASCVASGHDATSLFPAIPMPLLPEDGVALHDHECMQPTAAHPMDTTHYQPFANTLRSAEASYSDGLLPLLASTQPQETSPKIPRCPVGDEGKCGLASALQSRRLLTSRLTAR